MNKDDLIIKYLDEIKEDVKEVKKDLRNYSNSLTRVDTDLKNTVRRVSSIESFKMWSIRFFIVLPVTTVIAVITGCL